MPITFRVCDVAPGAPMPTLDRASALPMLLGVREAEETPVAATTSGPSGILITEGPGRISSRARPPARRIEALSESDARLVSATDANALVQAAHDAFYGHHPLVLSPDAVWLCLAQGLAHHIAQNAEALRSRFVRHEGKVKLTVERPDFLLGQPNPWPEAFAAFSGQIAQHIGKLRDLVVADFSTTTPVARAASEVVLMDAFQPYFEYEICGGCGIPAITLLGTPDDWRSIRRRAAYFSELGLEPWTDALLPVLDEIVRTSEGHVDVGFWRSFFRYQSGSGPSELTGWLLVLFPYLVEHDRRSERIVPNGYLGRWEAAYRTAEARKGWILGEPGGPGLLGIPSSLAGAPVRFVDVRDGSEHPLRFAAGLFGVVQHPTGALEPELGWAVLHEASAQTS